MKSIEKTRKGTLKSLDPQIYNEAIKALKDEDVRIINFEVTRIIAKVIRTMYGPKGLDKMIVPVSNEAEITQKGYKVVKSFKNRFPISLMLIELVTTQEDNCGDGTKTTLLFTALLLEKAKEMMSLGVSPQTINKGFSLALEKSLEILEDNVIPYISQDNEVLMSIIASVMHGKFSSQIKEHYMNLVLTTLEKNENLFLETSEFDFTDILYRKEQGRSTYDSELVNGMIIYKDKPNLSLPNKIINSKILLVQKSLDFFVPGNQEPYSRQVEIKSVEKYQSFSRFHNDYYQNLAKFFKQKGINVILSQKKINSLLIDYCASINIIALELVGEKEMKKLSKLLDVPVISSINDFSEDQLGFANLVEFRKVSGDEMFFIHLKNSKILTFLLRGGISYAADELEENLQGSLRVATQTLKDKKILPGGGALDCELSRILKIYAGEFPNKYQMVISEYAKALESLPGYLILNSAGDPLEIIPKLRETHLNGKKLEGFNCNTKKIVDVLKEGIFDGYMVKKHALKIATEMARQIVRVDALVMVYDRKLYEKIEKEGKEVKSQKHQEKVRKYLNKKDEDLFSDLYNSK